MKKILLMMLATLVATMAADAKTGQNPKGLYRLRQFVYEDGRTSPPSFSQYKYAADSVGLLVSFRPARTVTQWSSMEVQIREDYPLLNTGEKPQGPDGHGTQIYNVDDDQFCFKWYNDKWPGMSKLNEFIIEIYSKGSMNKEVTGAFDMLENKIKRMNKFCGWWVRVGATAATDGTGKRQAVPTIWKAYSPELSMVVNVANNGKVLGCSTTNTVKYDNDSTIWEIGHRCDIHWLNDDCHALTFVQENGQPLTEIWVKAGLPSSWQRVFKTNLETYRNGVDCMREAVEAAVKGDVQKADGLIAEAVEKNVSIEALSEGTMGIAMDLLTNKKQYKECVDFSQRQLQRIKNYSDDGHDPTIFSKLYVHMTEMWRAIATYRSGDHENGRKLMEERQSIVESEIERYQSVKGMEHYINLLYYSNFMMYCQGYDIFGTERTLLYLDALTMMAPNMTSQNKPLLLNCRGNCYLLSGDKDNARKLWQQIKEIDPDFFKKQPDDNRLKQSFGE